jgi:hypothetical protein
VVIDEPVINVYEFSGHNSNELFINTILMICWNHIWITIVFNGRFSVAFETTRWRCERCQRMTSIAVDSVLLRDNDTKLILNQYLFNEQ